MEQKILHLTLKKQWFDMIKSGKKLDPKQVALLVAIGAVGIVAYSLYKKSKRR